MIRPLLYGLAGVSALALMMYLMAPRPYPLLGTIAPELELDLMDGGQLDLAAHRGKDVVVLDFWATWCSPCRRTIPQIAGVVSREFSDQDVVLYTVNEGDAEPEIREFLTEVGVDVDVVLDRLGTMGDAYYLGPLPMTVIIGRDGKIDIVRVGAMGDAAAEIRRDLERVLRR